MRIWVVFVGDLVSLSSWLLTILKFWAALLGSNVLWKLKGMWLLPQGWSLSNTWKKVSCFSTVPCAWIPCSAASGNWAAISRSHFRLKTISQDPEGTMTDMKAYPKILLGILKPLLSFTVTVWHTTLIICVKITHPGSYTFFSCFNPFELHQEHGPVSFLFALELESLWLNIFIFCPG